MSRQIIAKWIREQLPKHCVNCGSTKSLVYHHIVPVAFDGNDIPSNIAVLCSNCHSKVHFRKNNCIDHNALIKEGIRKAKERGVRFGPMPVAEKPAVMQYIAENSTQFNPYSEKTEREIMNHLGLKPTQYYKYKRELVEQIQQSHWIYKFPRPKVCFDHPDYEGAIRRRRGY